MVNANDLFNVADWQVSIEARRQLARQIVSACVNDGQRIETLIALWKRHTVWDKMDDKAKNIANVMFTSLRFVVRQWRHVPEELRRQFLDGSKPYSAVASALRNEIL